MKKGFLSGASLYADGSSEADPSLWRSKGRAPVLSLRTTAAAYEVHGAFNEARQYLGKEDFEVTRSGATVRVRGKPDDPMSLIAGLDESVEVPLDGDFSKMSADFSEYQLRITIPRSPELAAMPPELLRLLHQVAKAEEAGEPVPPELLQQLQALSTANPAVAAEAAEVEGSYLPPEAYRLLLNCAAGGGVAASAVSVDFGAAHARRPHATDARIDERWAKAREGNARLFDGSKFRLRRVSGGGADGGPPHLELGLTGYREYVGTHLVDAAERRALEDDGERDHGERGAHMANALGCEAVLVTSDGHAVLLRRSGEVATHGGLYNGPSGHPEPSRAVVEGDDKETRAVEAAARVRNELYASVREAGDDLGPVTCWKFGDDTIDCSDALADALAAGGASTTVPLAGTHLTPVFFKLSATDVDPRLGALLGDVTYTLGDDAAIEALVDALAEWVWPMSKKPPTARVLEASS